MCRRRPGASQFVLHCTLLVSASPTLKAAVHTDFSIDPVRVEFVDPDTERDFQRHHLDHTRASLRLTLVFCSLFYVAFSLTDFAALGYGTHALVLLVGRLLVAFTAGVGLYLVRDEIHTIAPHRLAASAAEIVGMAVFMLVVWFRAGELPWHAMSLCIMLVVVYVFIPNRLITSIAIAFAATLAFIAIALTRGELKPSDDVTMSMLLLLVNSFGIVAARRYQQLWRDEYRVLMELKHLSIRDHLSGCFNRRHLHATLLPSEMMRARKGRQWITLMVCDIDHFKRINDSYGHQSGDAVLQHVAGTLQAMTRGELDSVVRYGGEEFLLVLPQTDLERAMRVAERLRLAVEQNPIPDVSGKQIAATMSIGVLSVNFATVRRTVSEATLIAAADALLYDAKKAGRNSIRCLQWTDELSRVATHPGSIPFPLSGLEVEVDDRGRATLIPGSGTDGMDAMDGLGAPTITR
ncbi:GGDEF domain-containing protein [Cupriavidus pauculus]|uniref:diguanylate cyclase n=1 Tax=Cupriavidus pauculus TaxID=82633 RepID=A0A5P2HCN4_9BURK|nr:GGDEF domain-containing protein [Cupriavidus pauculus]